MKGKKKSLQGNGNRQEVDRSVKKRQGEYYKLHKEGRGDPQISWFALPRLLESKGFVTTEYGKSKLLRMGGDLNTSVNYCYML